MKSFVGLRQTVHQSSLRKR